MPDLSKYRPKSMEGQWRSESAPTPEGESSLRHSMEMVLNDLEDELKSYDSETIGSLTEEIKRAHDQVGDNPGKIADFLEERARERSNTAQRIREGQLPVEKVIAVIRKNVKKPN